MASSRSFRSTTQSQRENAGQAFTVADDLMDAATVLRHALSEAMDTGEHAQDLLRRLPKIVNSHCDPEERDEWLRFATRTAANCRAIALALAYGADGPCECGA